VEQLHWDVVQDLTVAFLVFGFPHVNLQQQLVHPFHPSFRYPLLQHIPLGALDIHAHHRQVRVSMPFHYVSQCLHLIVGLLAIKSAITLVRAVVGSYPDGFEQMVHMSLVLLGSRHRRIERKDVAPSRNHEIIKDPVVGDSDRVHDTSSRWYGIQTDVDVGFFRFLTLQHMRIGALRRSSGMEQLVNPLVVVG